jgi:hypothetical protein
MMTHSPDDNPPLAPMTYSGLLDDAGRRYDPEADPVGESFFRRMIAKNIFFSGGILLNDGYLVNHPAARRELLREDSLLRVMMRTQNFIRVLTRSPIGSNVADMPVQMAESGNASFNALVKSEEWKELHPLLRRLSPMWDRGNRLVWPSRKMHVGFVLLILRALAAPPHQIGLTAALPVELDRLRDDFLARSPNDGNARHHFEQAALAVLADLANGGKIEPAHVQLAMHELMTIANQAYHYNFGLCLNEEAPEPIAVDTSIGEAFDELLQLDEIYDGMLDDIAVLRIPKFLPFHEGRKFDDLLDASTKIGDAKMRYLSTLEAVFHRSSEGPGIRLTEAKRDFGEATRQYRERIAEHFGQFAKGDFDENVFSAGISIGIGKLGDIATAGLGGIAVELLNNKMSPAEFLLRKMRIRELDTAMRGDIPPLKPDDYYRFSPAEIVHRHRQLRPKFSSVAFDRAKIAAHTSQVPPL